MVPDTVPRIEILSAAPDSVRLRQGARTSQARSRAGGLEETALAALAALAELLPATIAITLEDLHLVPGRRDVVVVVLVVRVGGVPLPHVGAALRGGDPELATVRAVIDAVNRRLVILGA